MILLLCTMAYASEPVIEQVESGIINWSTMELEITSRSDRDVGAWGATDRRVQEQDALHRLAPMIQDAAKRILVQPDRTAADYLGPKEALTDIEIARRLDDGLKGWRVRETRYLSNGGVEMDGVLELHRWLRPVLLASAGGTPQAPNPDGPTGILLDARHVDFRPCLAPEIHTATGEVLAAPSSVHAEVLRKQAPVTYVQDPSDRIASERTGKYPLFLSAESARDECVLVLTKADSQLLSTSPTFPGVVSTGKLVVVVSP
ncbi:MAG: hypothetical protein ACPGTU_14870 [Myxococcota bacterium]